MKMITLAGLLCLATSSVFAQDDIQVLNSAPINVDGFYTDKPQTDGELANIQSEIQKQKQEIVLNKEKAKGFKELSKSVVVLSETTEEMLEEKREAKQEIADYNAKIKCLQSDSPGAECDKYVRRRQ